MSGILASIILVIAVVLCFFLDLCIWCALYNPVEMEERMERSLEERARRSANKPLPWWVRMWG